MKRSLSRLWFGTVTGCAVLLIACGDGGAPTADPLPDATPTPLSELGGTTYLGFAGGLYPGGTVPPAGHHDAGVRAAARVAPRDTDGNSDPSGRYVLLSIGMSNTTQEFCSASSVPPCDSWTFTGQALADPAVNQTALAIVNGARGGQAAEDWESPGHPNYDRIRDERLAPAGLSEQQVQVVWLKVANARPTAGLPDPAADAYELARRMGNIVRAMATRYQNLALVFVSSRIYAGYATTTLNPEPYAYESGFGVKWLIEAQLTQRETGAVDPVTGDLDPSSTPWLGWGAYLWAAGPTPRADGLVWLPEDFASDGTHPSAAGEAKVGRLLLQFFTSSPYAAGWFLD